MERTPRALAALILLLAGCSTRYAAPQLGTDHPASVEAEAGSASDRKSVLDVAAADPIQDAAQAPAAHGHGGHTMREDDPAPVVIGAPGPYTCPMHPEVVSDRPGQMCPKCGMELEKPEEAPR